MSGGGPPKFGAGPCGGGAPKPGGGWKFASLATIVPASALTLGLCCVGPKSGMGAGAGAGAAIGGAGVGGVGGRWNSGIFAEPGIGGATPTIVPFSLLGGGPAGRGGSGAPLGAGAAPAGGVPPTPGGSPWACWLVMSIVPLNFGAAAPLRLKLHFEHVSAVSSFFVPQFGQNTEPPRGEWEP